MRGERKKEGIKGGDERDITETGNGKRRGKSEERITVQCKNKSKREKRE